MVGIHCISFPGCGPGQPCQYFRNDRKDSRVCPWRLATTINPLSLLYSATIMADYTTDHVMVNRKQITQPWMACTQEDAKPYKGYEVLYGERKFARDFVSYGQTAWPFKCPPYGLQSFNFHYDLMC